MAQFLSGRPPPLRYVSGFTFAPWFVLQESVRLPNRRCADMAREGRIGWISACRPLPPRCVFVISGATLGGARHMRGVPCRPRRVRSVVIQPVASASQVCIYYFYAHLSILYFIEWVRLATSPILSF